MNDQNLVSGRSGRRFHAQYLEATASVFGKTRRHTTILHEWNDDLAGFFNAAPRAGILRSV